jgi:hypothetical protein
MRAVLVGHNVSYPQAEKHKKQQPDSTPHGGTPLFGGTPGRSARRDGGFRVSGFGFRVSGFGV